MMLHVYNTLSKQKEPFEPANPPFVGMYVCGPTVYDDPHLGHAKSYVSFDVIVRFLRALKYKVRYVQNITDVGHLLEDSEDGEDRIIKKAKLEKVEPIEIAQKYERHYFHDMDLLNNLRPDISCRASGYIPEMIELVKTLLDKGYAYENEGNVYFDIAKFEGYGKLSGRKIEDLLEGVRDTVAEGKRHSADFALWKKADPQHIMQWLSPWGRGYPGWHLECSVMSMKYLGESIDIHGGGLDNQFPHHECEIAQSEAATGKPFVKYWLHNNMVTINGQKMSKSLGNFKALPDLFETYGSMVIRFFILQGHYRSPQDFSDQALDAAKAGFTRLSKIVQDIRSRIGETVQNLEDSELSEPWKGYKQKFYEYMEDDFNTAGAVSVLFDMAKESQARLQSSPEKTDLECADKLFHALGESILGLAFKSENAVSGTGTAESELVEFLLELRQDFRAKKDWAASDAIRDRLGDMGILVEDGKDGASWRKA
ncbi:cysteine--tRNA ligase [bacterium]|nr:cysteine--tRNA ligase [bacterium]